MQNYLLNRIKWSAFILLLVMSFHTGHAENLKTEKSQVSPLEELLIAFTTNPTVSLWNDVNQIKSIS